MPRTPVGAEPIAGVERPDSGLAPPGAGFRPAPVQVCCSDRRRQGAPARSRSWRPAPPRSPSLALPASASRPSRWAG